MVMRQQLSWNARIFRYIGILKNWPDDQSRFVDHEWGHPRAMRPCSPSKSLFSFGFHIFLARSLFHASSHALKNSTGNLKSLHVFAVLRLSFSFCPTVPPTSFHNTLATSIAIARGRVLHMSRSCTSSVQLSLLLPFCLRARDRTW